MPIRFAAVFLAALCGSGFTDHSHAAERPNILWLFAEDTSPWMGCYGDPINRGATPHIDSLAAGGVRFSRAFVPAPVCSACNAPAWHGSLLDERRRQQIDGDDWRPRQLFPLPPDKCWKEGVLKR